MGTVTIMVGCPHRLDQPIGAHTRYPCTYCALYGGWGGPRWAYAQTVERCPREPRLAEAAVTSGAKAPTRFEPVRGPSLAAVVERIRERRRMGAALAQSDALVLALADAAASVAQQMVFGHSHMEVQTGALDPATNTVAMRAVLHSRIGVARER